jgi:formylmethanofuran dehydrogenase subunit A
MGEDTCRQRHWGNNPPEADSPATAWIRSTRSLPAQHLGLSDRGHLRPGARADVALYDLPGHGTSASWPESFRRCRILLKAGEVVVNNHEVVNYRVSKTSYYRQTQTGPNQMVADICGNHSFRLENLLVRPQTDVHWQQVP